ncbi:MAG: cysteine desulfurase [Candidatus Schekmanbacteria bacterium RIFCSPHIGHO2_02_FULL_38_11]|uniref:cysteine desulfurase n=1 Tax=Candidatus Schekmanbacteria bacterium RIFCSPLOWO2_12_FULL_38_15 TaxID=1817883 RepID=A0A1F7SEB7_9BACT|nr:MAG: cysteine desulfurase [Candidatus Schekmanbacteria bacterium GWA2_38_9]OGL48979.1 MAG: cysteine desulfurase [Candidatus Schekmanbacteria bacterium RIFCSPHIGHO2_02_FULL_38_11]OGL49134.1 MAG: cysteine desulfurase [Candidatus Schekmanbacteria bacterium RIFCSPLOWO2_02_FULL_38_14]OGL52110.1 MAG: cysteine desulfurase [Candidatus Schekmanbacteria bacterium RIFCSPLOWO2_12_FULL_38_15]
MPIYLDNAATSFPKPPQVYEAVDHAMRNIGGSPGRGSHRMAVESARMIFETREDVAKFFNFPDSSRVIFTSNATDSLNLGLKGLLSPGNHVITSYIEHNSVTRPLKSLKKNGIEVTKVKTSSEGFVDPEDIKKAFKKNTKLVVINHASNVLGSINPVEEIGSICKKKGIKLLVDAAQTAGTIPVDIIKGNIDIFACSGHKSLFGIQGTGILIVGEEINLNSLKEGGTGSFSDDESQPEFFPDKLESGTLNTPGIASIKAGIDFINKTGIENIRKHKLGLTEQFLSGLSETKGILFYGTGDFSKKIPVLSFNIEGMQPGCIEKRLDEDFYIISRAGLHCSPDSHKTAGTYPDGAIRISPGFFNTFEDIDLTIDAIRKIAKSL